MSRAVLSLGSNLGDRHDFLRLAVEGLRASLVVVSGVYETAAWGVREQPDFLNAVCIVDDPEVDHWGWLRRARELEQAARRTREQRWGPRTLDVDVVTVDDVRSDDPELLLPHPGTPERATVLIPWLEIDPDAEVPGHGRAADLLAALSEADRAGVRLRDDLTL
jgi:2-amino-4-hydroxy-6-hydroxymethyldihydropteridine diphosphokinase